jgi:hypothetical protein
MENGEQSPYAGSKNSFKLRPKQACSSVHLMEDFPVQKYWKSFAAFFCSAEKFVKHHYHVCYAKGKKKYA